MLAVLPAPKDQYTHQRRCCHRRNATRSGQNELLWMKGTLGEAEWASSGGGKLLKVMGDSRFGLVVTAALLACARFFVLTVY